MNKRLLRTWPLLVLAALVGSMSALLVRAEGEDKERVTDSFPVRRVRLAGGPALAQELKRLGETALVRLPRSDFEDLLRRARQNRLLAPPRLLEARYRAQLFDPAPVPPGAFPNRSPGTRKDPASPPSLTGTAWWKVVSNSSGPVLLELSGPNQGFNLAVKQPRFENRDAVLTWFGPPSSRAVPPEPARAAGEEGGPALLIDQPGEQVVTFDWSARAEMRPEGIQVDLRLPSCPVALLELDLPMDRSVAALLTAPEGPLITGPHPAEAADRRLWKVLCGGRSSLPLLIRRAPGPEREDTPLLARTRTVQRLDPEGLTALYQIDLEARHQGVVELVCACDPVLRPVQVLAPGIDQWKVEPGPPGQPSLLTVRLREPVREGSLLVRCLAPLASVRAWEGGAGAAAREVSWASPGLYLQRAIPRGEQLELWLHPDLGSVDWHPGGFRLIASTFEAGEPSLTAPIGLPGEPASRTPPGPEASEPGGTTKPAPAGALPLGGKWQRFTLVGGGVDLEGAGVRRPRPAGGPEGLGERSEKARPVARPEVRLKPFAVEFRARQLAWWRIRPPAGGHLPGEPPGWGGGQELIVQIQYDLQAGQLFQLPVELPAGWDVGSVSLTGGPGQQPRNWSTHSEKGPSILLVDLVQPLHFFSRFLRHSKGPSILLVDLVQPLRPVDPGARRADSHAKRANPAYPTLLVRLFPTHPGSVVGRDLKFPDSVPLGARFREGALGIDVDEEVYQARVRLRPGTGAGERGGTRAEVPDASGPWKEEPGFYQAYQGAGVEGTLHLQVRPPRVRASCRTLVFVASGRPAGALHSLGAELSVLVEAQRGSPDTLDLVLSTATGSDFNPPRGKIPPPPGAGQGETWRWQVLSPQGVGPNPTRPGERAHETDGTGPLPTHHRLRRVERWYPGEVGGGLAGLAARGPWQAALFAWARPPGQRWRLVFDKPLPVHQPVLLTAMRTLAFQAEPAKEREPFSRLPGWEVPLLSVLGASSFEGEVTLGPLVPPSVQVEGAPDLSLGSSLSSPEGAGAERADSSRRARDRPAGEQGPGGRTFRYHHPTARMVIPGLLPKDVPANPPQAAALPEGLLGPARLVTSVSRTGVTKHRFLFRVRDWPERTLPIHLPSGARLIQAFADGRCLEGVEIDPEKGGLELPVPVPASPTVQKPEAPLPPLTNHQSPITTLFEVVYTTGEPRWLWPWITLEAPLPSLRPPPSTVQRRWRLPPDLAPLGSSRYRPVPGVGEAIHLPRHRPLGLGDLFDPLPSLAWLRFSSQDLAVRRQTVADASAGLRIRFRGDPPHPGPLSGRERGSQSGARTLDDLVEELASGYLKSAHPLVLDRVALDEAGLHGRVSLTGATQASDPSKGGQRSVRPKQGEVARDGLPGSERGLVALVGHAGILLTTRQQVERWVPHPAERSLFWFTPDRDDLPGALEAPVLEAARHGEDSSGRFCSALTWLATPSSAARETFPEADAGEIDGNWSSWSEWEEVPAGSEEASTLTAIHLNSVTITGLALGVGLLFVGWLLSRRRPGKPLGNGETSSLGERTESSEERNGRAPPRRGRVPRLYLLLWLALAGVGLVWLPASLQMLAWWPLLFGLGFSLAVLLSWGFQIRDSRRAAPSRVEKSTAPSHRSARPNQGEGARSGGSSNKPAGSSARRVLPVLLGIVLAAGASQAFPSAGPATNTDTVYLVPAPADAPEKETVLAPPALLERLRDTCRPGLAPTHAFLLSATYEGKLIDKMVEFQAVFQVQVLTAGVANLALPLEGVQLQGNVWVDGARTLPIVSPIRPPGSPEGGEKTVYLLEVRGQGQHKVELHFRVPVTVRGNAEEARLRSFKFTAPRLPQNHLTLTLPAEAVHLHVAALHGSQRLVREASGSRLELDLGGLAGPVQVLWFQETKPPRKPRVEFREAWIWDLRVDASSLTGLLLGNITGAPMTSLELELPATLEVRSVEAQRAPGSGRDSPVELPVRLRDWRVERPAAGAHRLVLELTGPVTGGVEVILELVPRAPLPDTVALPLPRPLGEVPGFSYLAYRGEGLEVTPDWVAVKAIPPQQFAPFWPASSRPDLTGLNHVEFNRESRNLGFRTRLGPQAFSVDATHAVEVKIGSDRFPDAARVRASAGVESVSLADVKVVLSLDASGGIPPVVSWESPPSLTVASITGRDVRRWTRMGNRITIWLERAADFSPRLQKGGAGASPIELELVGWLPLSAPAGKPGTVPQRLELPCLRPLFPGKHTTRVHLETGPGLRLLEKKVRKLSRAGSPSDHERRYESRENDYEASFEIQPTPSPRYRVWTRVEMRARRLEFTSTIELQPPAVKGGPRAELKEVLVRVSGWPSEAVQLEAPAGTVLREHDHKSPKVAGSASSPPAPGGGSPRPGLVSVPVRESTRARVWWLELQPGQTGPYRLTLTGSLPRSEARGEIFLPDVAVPSLNEEPVPTQSVETSEAGGERWLTLVGDVTPVEVQGLEPSSLPAELAGGQAARQNQGEGARGGLVWKVKESHWQLRLPRDVSPGDRASRRSRLELLHAEHTVVVVGGRRSSQARSASEGSSQARSASEGSSQARSASEGIWLRETVLWVRHDGQANLNLRWSTPVRILSVSLDGVLAAPAETHGDSTPPGTTTRLASTLPDRTGVCCLRVRWRGEAGEESLEDPGLVWPRLEGDESGQLAPVPGAKAVWTIRVPLGWSLAGWRTRGLGEQGDAAVPSKVTGSARWALLELGRARVELERSRLLVERAAEKSSEALLAAQTRFYQAGQYLEAAIEATPAGEARRVLETLGVRASWDELREQNKTLASRSAFEKVREQAERTARTGGGELLPGEPSSAEERLPRQGIPISWQTEANQESASPLLVPERLQQTRQALTLSGEWLLLLALGMVLGLSAGLRTLTRWLAPELLALVAVFGWHLVGPTLVVVFLLALAGAARLILLLQIAPRVFSARSAPR